MKRKKPPLEQIAWDAFVRYTEKNTPENKAESERAWLEWRAVAEGRAEPLPQYRG